jgi:hypothetical protein
MYDKNGTNLQCQIFFGRTKLKLAQKNVDILNISLHVQKMVQFVDRWGLN